jgi:hypothetical protein
MSGRDGTLPRYATEPMCLYSSSLPCARWLTSSDTALASSGLRSNSRSAIASSAASSLAASATFFMNGERVIALPPVPSRRSADSGRVVSHSRASRSRVRSSRKLPPSGVSLQIRTSSASALRTSPPAPTGGNSIT